MKTPNKKSRHQIQDEFDRTILIEDKSYGQKIVGYLTNFKTLGFIDKTNNEERTGMLCYFVGEDGVTFKTILKFSPYFYLSYREGYEKQARMYIESKVKKYESIEIVDKVDLEEMNHLSGKPKCYIKLSFKTVGDLTNARMPIKQMLDGRKGKETTTRNADDHFLTLYDNHTEDIMDSGQSILGIRQFDIPYHSRVCIDTQLRAGKWFEMDIKNNIIEEIRPREDLMSMPELKVLAFDIETSKDPLKFPDAQKDCIMMISLMFDSQAYLIVNLGFCGQKVIGFEYNPKPQYACGVTVFNVQSEKALIEKFFYLIHFYRPEVITSFNGDKFDVPFIKTRCTKLDIDFQMGCGFYNDNESEFYGRYISHLDCYYWVDRDAYLPQGSHGLKAVTKAKLQYDPIEVDPEDMVELARQATQKLAEYSISDAVATYFLYMKHIHDFIFALCTIIPMYPDEVLRKGSGTLCQNLLMAQAFNRNIIFPNKKAEQFMKIVDGHRIDSQTYTGGKVECLRTGVYRADFQTDFQFDPRTFQFLIDNIDNVLKFAIELDAKNQSIETCTNYQSVKSSIISKLQALRDVKNPHKHMTQPLIYHLDVAAMYPNIILTNRLQPVAIVNEKICGNCIYVSEDGANCKRQLEWEWKGEVFPLTESEYVMIQNRLDLEIRSRSDEDFCKTQADYQKQLKKRVKLYCQKSYKKTHINKAEVRRDTVCMRQNSFYVDTVRAFRDRRYDFKAKVKVQKGQLDKCSKKGDHGGAKQAKSLMALYESLQLAHKIILNSFYGYVMRKGARWYSMETAAMVTYIGSNIISDCKNFIQGRIGKPLELDTDGIWLLLPKGFPENESFKFSNGDSCHLSYPCAILNEFIYQKYLNNQYQQLNPKTLQYDTRTQMSIQFEIDGPYKAMFIPAAKEKQKTTELDTTLHNTQLLKKRYVVYNFKNQISEFKGFEMKRRGQLEIVKVFQSQIFHQYLKGSNLYECYQACAKVALDKVNLLLRKGQNISHYDLISYLQESKVLSKDLKEYDRQKGVAVTSAKRLSEFLGPNTIKGKGICCYFVISEKPVGSPVTERAIPTSIFQADEMIQRQFLGKWLGQKLPENEPIDIKKILDWNYYFQRLSSTIQKMVCIPAVLQNLDNPLPEVPLPDWLGKKTFDERIHKQLRINMFNLVPIPKRIEQERKTTAADKVTKAINRQPLPKPTVKVNPYSLTKQFSKWLEYQKQQWKSVTSETNNGFSNQWSILQLVPSKTPGAYILWMHSGTRVSSTEVVLNRKYYVSNKLSKRAIKKAPRDDGLAQQVVIDQIKFLKQQQYYDSFIGNQTYETKIPLETSFIINTGNMCRVKERLNSYKQQQLHPIFGQEYLKNYEIDMPMMHIVSVPYIKNAVWGIYYEPSEQYRFVFHRHKFSKQGSDKNAFYKIARNAIGSNHAKIEIQAFDTMEGVANYINQAIKIKRLMIRSSFLVVLRSHHQIKYLKSIGINELQSEVPVVALQPVNLTDTNISSLDWKQRLLKVNIEQAKENKEMLYEIIRYARYSHIPLCNLSTIQNRLDTITTIMFSRVLRAGDNLLWWDDYNRTLDLNYESDVYTGRINNPGLYSTFCIEFDIAHMVTTAILVSDQLLGYSSSVSTTQNKKGKVEILDDMACVQTAFEYLKKMIKAFLEDVSHGSEEGDTLNQNICKWIYTKDNALYDPLLHRMVKQISKKLFYELMLKIKSMGFKIVFANFQRIIINTDNNTRQQAVNRTRYMLGKCLEDDKKKYKSITFSTTRVWKTLLWRDTFNFGGYIENLDQTDEFEYFSEWKMANCMTINPKFFTGPIYQFIKTVHESRDQIYLELSKNQRQLYLNLNQRMSAFLCEFIEDQYSPMMIEGMLSLHRNWNTRMENQDTMEVESISEEQYQESDEENDSFVVEDDVFDQDGDLQVQMRKKGVKVKKNEQLMKWGDTHQIDKLIENIFAVIKTGDEAVDDKLYELRCKALTAIGQEPLIARQIIKPIYPLFEIACPSCYRINESPGICQCKQPLVNIDKDIENSIWKMMSQIGRDMWCESCKANRYDYLKHCPCGGKWVLDKNPLAWIPYTDRSENQWQFVNKVFDFMGLASGPV